MTENNSPAPTPRWLGNALAAVHALGERPVCLYVALLAINALALPYAGFIHDARLYAVQTLNRAEPGSFADDLFLRYGSQDQYSVFSLAVAPLASVLGLNWSFFLAYLVSSALFLLALQRFTRALIANRAVSTAALLFMAATALHYGGDQIFVVNESFLTPRLLANALVLFGLERALRGRWGLALLLLVAAAAMHPIMALGGFGVLAAWAAVEHLPRRLFWILAGMVSVAAVIVLACPPLAARLFGQMDAVWLEEVWGASPYNFPLHWPTFDWFQTLLALALAVTAGVVLVRQDPRRGHFVLVLAVVAAAGLAATCVASHMGYTLLFQAQPYRALWLIQVLHAPLTFLLGGRLWQQGAARSRLLAVCLVGHLALVNYLPEEFTLIALFLLVAVVIYRGFEAAPRVSDWAWRSVAVALVAGALAWGAYRAWLNIRFADVLNIFHERMAILLQTLAALGPVYWMALALTAVAWLQRRVGLGRGACCTLLGVAVVAQLAVFLVPQTELYETHCKKYASDIRFVRDFLAQRRAGPARPTVYWSNGRVDIVWLELNANSFYERPQVQGVLFNRRTALEGHRRAVLVGAFEMERLRTERAMVSERWKGFLEAYYGVLMDQAQPTHADLEKLCRETAVDYAIIRQRFDGLYAATNGEFYIYDCRQVRIALGQGSPDDRRAAVR